MNKTETPKTKVLFIDAYACDEFGDGPRFAKVEINQGFINRLISLQEVLKENDLEECRIDCAPDEWDAQDDLRLRGNSLCIMTGCFYFKAYPKHCSYNVETRMVEIKSLIEGFESAEPVLFMGSDPSGLKLMIEEDAESEQTPA